MPSPLPDHRSCEALTHSVLKSLQQLPREGISWHVRRYPKGAYIWHPADPADRILFLEAGEVVIVASDPLGHEVIKSKIRAGESFGELCFCSVTDKRRHSFCRVVSDSRVVEISVDHFFVLLANNREMLEALTYTFCARLSAAEEKIDVLMQRNAEARLGRLLISLATAGRLDPNATEVTLQVSHNELAQMAAMNRSHTTVTLGKFREKGLIKYDRSTPLTVNVQTLLLYMQLESDRHQP